MLRFTRYLSRAPWRRAVRQFAEDPGISDVAAPMMILGRCTRRLIDISLRKVSPDPRRDALWEIAIRRAKYARYIASSLCWLDNIMALPVVCDYQCLPARRPDPTRGLDTRPRHPANPARHADRTDCRRGRVAEGSSSFRLRLTSVSGFPRAWLNIRWPCDDHRLRPLQTGRAGFPHPASPNPLGLRHAQRVNQWSSATAAGQGAAGGQRTTPPPGSGRGGHSDVSADGSTVARHPSSAG